VGPDRTRIDAHDTPIEITPGLLLWAGKKKVVKLEIE
jgi:hypothetical protein